MVVQISERYSLRDRLQEDTKSSQSSDLSKENEISEIKNINVIQLNIEKANSIKEPNHIWPSICHSLIDTSNKIYDHSLQIDSLETADIYQKESNEISKSFDPSTDNEKASKVIWSFHDYCRILEPQHQNDQNTIEKTVFRYSGDTGEFCIVGKSYKISCSFDQSTRNEKAIKEDRSWSNDFITRKSDECVIISDHQHQNDQNTPRKRVSRYRRGRSSKDSVNDWKENMTKSGKQIELAAHKVKTKDSFIRDYSSRLLLAPEMTMLLLVLWIHVISVSSKISVRNTKEKHHVSNQVKLKCQLCVDKNRATSRCNTCRKNICSFCKMYHEKVWTVMNHDVHPLQ